MPKKVTAKPFKPFKTKRTLSRVAKRKIFMPKRPKQVFSIANNGRKVRHGVSGAEVEWLNKLGVPERSKIIILFGKTYVVDGFDPKTNTCYEYNGDRFHGSHKVYKNNRNINVLFISTNDSKLITTYSLEFIFIKISSYNYKCIIRNIVIIIYSI